jgi:hypothetical protein
MFWFQDAIVFHFVNRQTNKAKNAQNAKNAVLDSFNFLHRAKTDISET